MNYNDSRNCAPASAPILYTDKGEIELPIKWTVCDVCHGEGKHVNPAIDDNGLCAEDFENDPDFHQDYMSGVYDQACNRCKGRTTVQAVDWENLTSEQSESYKAQLREEEDDRAAHLA